MSCTRSGSLAVFKVTARDQDHYKGPLGAFVTYCNISCLKYSIYMYYKCKTTSLPKQLSEEPDLCRNETFCMTVVSSDQNVKNYPTL